MRLRRGIPVRVSPRTPDLEKTHLPPSTFDSAPAGPGATLPTPDAGVPSSRAGRTVGAAFVTALAALLMGYLVVTVPGKWFTSVAPARYDARSLGVTAGTGALAGDALVVAPQDASGAVIVSVSTALRSTDYPGIAWDVSDLPAGAVARLLWRNEYAPARMFTLEIPVEGGRLAPVVVSRDANWIGRVTGLALALKLPSSEPVRIRGVTAQTLSAGAVLSQTVREWLTLESWSGSSINTVVGGADFLELPLPALLGLATAIAAVTMLALARWRPAWVGPRLPAALAAMFFAAWFALDVRWQWNLARQVRATGDQYAGKSWREKHLASEDGPLFAFIEKVRTKLSTPTARVFVFADSHYFRGRGAYHLYPYNVYFNPSVNAAVPAAALRPGDYVVVYQRHGVEYDAAQQRLRWDGDSPVTADLLLAESGGALFRIR